MYIVYILFSLKDRKLYMGLTADLVIRLKQHKAGQVRSTQNRRPLKLIYYEVYSERNDAERREKYLKGGNGRAGLKIQLRTCLEKLKYRYI